MATITRDRLRALVRARRAARHRALRQPDFFWDAGEVHPIRDSPGYSELEERAHERERQRHHGHERNRLAYETGIRLADSARAYRELQGEILRERGIRPGRDYEAGDIPRDVRRRDGKEPDLMAELLRSRGYHYADGEALLADLRKRRRLLEGLGLLQRA